MKKLKRRLEQALRNRAVLMSLFAVALAADEYYHRGRIRKALQEIKLPQEKKWVDAEQNRIQFCEKGDTP